MRTTPMLVAFSSRRVPRSSTALEPGCRLVTVKPVALVADAIKDVSKRKGIVLDPFGGSGTTIIAAEKAGRRARAIELDPKYVDVAVHRWERYTGKTVVLEAIRVRGGERQRRSSAGGGMKTGFGLAAS